MLGIALYKGVTGGSLAMEVLSNNVEVKSIDIFVRWTSTFSGTLGKENIFKYH